MPLLNTTSTSNQFRFSIISVVCLLVFTVGVTWFIANKYYSISKKELDTFRSINESLVSANVMVELQNRSIAFDWQQKKKMPELAYYAAIWSRKIDSAVSLSSNITAQVEQLKTALRQEAGLGDADSAFNKNNAGMINSSFFKNGIGKSLGDSLTHFATMLSTLIPHHDGLRFKISSLSNLYLQIEKAGETCMEAYCKDLPAVAAIANLSKLENDILMSSNAVVQYCNEQISDDGWFDFNRQEVFVGQNSNVFELGQTIEISVGIGAFKMPKETTVIIDGIPQEDNGKGFVTFKKVVGEGENSIPVSISYRDGNTGKMQLATKVVSYGIYKMKQ